LLGAGAGTEAGGDASGAGGGTAGGGVAGGGVAGGRGDDHHDDENDQNGDHQQVGLLARIDACGTVADESVIRADWLTNALHNINLAVEVEAASLVSDGTTTELLVLFAPARIDTGMLATDPLAALRERAEDVS